ncbi:OLC1v1031826C1 [Oldenlandia corymbosa var. corymbosa]|uniref:OLC1v1031826C1 n=1 Tax=Oldenlandia corymbosa var. corymbosa TaxID=529605 RepID=A0AAV1CLF2_OLDCO|nr:OLC1v1031826C1 [Oldenlandia corymbosa var. corymbosa]
MAGHGGLINGTWDGVVSPESRPNPNILKLNPMLQWEEAEEPLHAGIDPGPNGIGPGMPFANLLLQKIPNYGIIGLVPCAVSGTSIILWQKGTILYNQLMDRAMAALQNGDGNGNENVIEALLWYQGESDTTTLIDAKAYKARLQQFIMDLRTDLNLPDLLVLQVALASGLGKISKSQYVERVREAQLNIELPNVKYVDAMGLPLQPDNIHLTTSAQVRLGNMLSHEFTAHQNSFADV